tara:strand:+ start:32 stop:208 length:177 start_codon:yes stop_codon:yes gene_type:complete
MSQEKESNLDKQVLAECECGKETRTVTFRNLKNRWPMCKCKKPMKVKGNAVPPISTTD